MYVPCYRTLFLIKLLRVNFCFKQSCLYLELQKVRHRPKPEICCPLIPWLHPLHKQQMRVLSLCFSNGSFQICILIRSFELLQLRPCCFETVTMRCTVPSCCLGNGLLIWRWCPVKSELYQTIFVPHCRHIRIFCLLHWSANRAVLGAMFDIQTFFSNYQYFFFPKSQKDKFLLSQWFLLYRWLNWRGNAYL